jgi:hypothetical protein
MPDDEDEGQEYEKTGAASLTATTGMEVSAEVKRGLNDIRLAVLGILVTIGLTVGFGISVWCGWWGVLAGIGSFVIACGLIKWGWSRNKLMEFAHWLTGH